MFLLDWCGGDGGGEDGDEKLGRRMGKRGDDVAFKWVEVDCRVKRSV